MENAAIVVIVLAAALAFPFLRAKRSRRKALSRPFPEDWRAILQGKVEFYRSLSAENKARFERDILSFLHGIRITGIKTTVSDADRLLVAASAVIPIFGFPEWEYTNLKEVLLYPATFNEDFAVEGADRRILGMVGTGVMNNLMILSKAELHRGFEIDNDKKNVGIHEFVHLLDKADGVVDGIPQELLRRRYTLPWLDLMCRKMDEIRQKQSDIRDYGGTAKEEFFAVASEYFFERPRLLKDRHPQIYANLSRVFRQDLASRVRNRLHGKQRIGRNDPCPCGSGTKFKKCCGRRTRA